MRRGLPTAAVLFMMFAAACAPVASNQAAPPPASAVPVTAAPAPAPAASLATADIKLTQVANIPAAITMAVRTGDSSIYIGTQDGLIYRLTQKNRLSLVFDFTGIVNCCGERGLLGMTFNAAGTKLYLHFSRNGDGWTEVSEFGFTTGDFGDRRMVLTWPQPESNHNGGSLLLGPDDYLYLALGDGGGGNDDWPSYVSHPPTGNGQDPDDLLGKIVRFDPAPDPGSDVGESPLVDYTVPAGNPFIGAAPGHDAIWSLGLRNPFRMSFDRSTGDLWVGDVGQQAREEINFVAFGGATTHGKGVNFQWNREEGEIDGPDTSNPLTIGTSTAPVLHPSHVGNQSMPFALDPPPGDCAIIGGYVYRGTRIPDLVGAYVYTDFCDTALRAFTPNGSSPPAALVNLGSGVSNPSSFGEGPDGELYVLSLATGVWRIDPDGIYRGLPGAP